MSDRYAWFEGEINRELLAKVKKMSEPSDVEWAKERLRGVQATTPLSNDVNPIEDIRTLLSELDRLTQELDALKRDAAAEQEGTLALRRKCGARDDETLPAFVERLTRELREAHAALDNCGVARGSIGHSVRYRIGLLGEEAAEVADLRAKRAAVEVERDAARARWYAAERECNEAYARGRLDAEAQLAELQRENERLKAELAGRPFAESLKTAIERIEKLEDELAAWREAESLPDCKACAVLGAAQEPQLGGRSS